MGRKFQHHSRNLALFFFLLSFLGKDLSALPRPDDVDLDKLIEKYEDEDFVSLSCNEEIVFQYDTRTDKVFALLKHSEKFISLKSKKYYYESIPYDSNSSVEKIDVFDDKGRKEKVYEEHSSLIHSDVFSDDSRLCSFSYYAYDPGETFEIYYEKKFTDVRYLTRVFFHESYPIIERNIDFKVPILIEVELVQRNFSDYNITTKKTNDKGFSVTSFQLKGIDPFTEEEHTPSLLSVYPHVLVLTKRYVKNGQKTNYLSTIDDLYNWYYGLLEEFPHDVEFKNKVKDITAGSSDDTETIESIYYWVQDNIRYIAFEDGIMGYKPGSPQKVLSDLYGDCKGMANLTKHMLTEKGFDARLCWIGTKSIPYDTLFPSLAIDNHMICGLVTDTGMIFLDPTERFVPLFDYAERIQGKLVLVEDGRNYLVDRIPSSGYERNSIKLTVDLTLVANSLQGSITAIYRGDERIDLLNFKEAIQTSSHDDLYDFLYARGNRNISISNTILNDYRSQGECRIDCNVGIEKAINTFGDEIYIKLNSMTDYLQFKIDTARIMDYQLNNSGLYEEKISLTIPEGFRIEHIPERLEVLNDEFVLEMEYRVYDNKLELNKTMKYLTDKISKKNYNSWNDLTDKYRRFTGSQIVLKKNENHE